MEISRREALIGGGGIAGGTVVVAAYFISGFGNGREVQIVANNNSSIRHKIAIIISDPEGDIDYFSEIGEIESNTQSEFDSNIRFGEYTPENAYVNILLDSGQYERSEVDFGGVDALEITINTDESLTVKTK